MSRSTGGLSYGRPWTSRARIEARSKRNPSTWKNWTHQRRLSRISRRATGCAALIAFPVPLKFRYFDRSAGSR
jgi:hypothetical protein